MTHGTEAGALDGRLTIGPGVTIPLLDLSDQEVRAANQLDLTRPTPYMVNPERPILPSEIGMIALEHVQQKQGEQ